MNTTQANHVFIYFIWQSIYLCNKAEKDATSVTGDHSKLSDQTLEVEKQKLYIMKTNSSNSK